MSRFYVGQPVVCLFTSEEWGFSDWQAIWKEKPPIPVKGQKYYVSAITGLDGTGGFGDKQPAIKLSGFGSWAYLERAFAPITDTLVKEIIANSQPVLSNVRVEALPYSAAVEIEC